MYARLLDDVVDLHRRTVTEGLAGGLAAGLGFAVGLVRRWGIVELGRLLGLLGVTGIAMRNSP
jgi:hypothetical protein